MPEYDKRTFNKLVQATWPEGFAKALQPDPAVLQAGDTDARLAERFGLTYCQVRWTRVYYGLDPAPRGKVRKRSDQLGALPDAELARQTGVSRQAVWQVRSGLGIPKFEPAVANKMSAP